MKTQYIEKNKDGLFYYSDKEMTTYHREDGPAVEYADGSKVWWLNDQLHREDGPAIEYANGYKAWYLNDQLHREDGPAIEWVDGTKEWWLNGKCMTEQEHAKRTKKVPTIEINGRCFTVEELNELIKTTW